MIINNLGNSFRLRNGLVFIFFTLCRFYSVAQDKLTVISRWETYQQQVAKDPEKKMVELSKSCPGIIYDLRYATTNNFMKRRMYPVNIYYSFLRSPVADALGKVQEELKQKGLGLKVFDAYRPYSVTVKFWELVKDERYVANPAKGSGHNKGIAIDLTIIDLKTKKELPMGTGFDNFSDTAHHVFTSLPAEILQNRKLLRSTMEKYGFKALESEWWHYFFARGEKFEVLDLEFKKLKKQD